MPAIALGAGKLFALRATVSERFAAAAEYLYTPINERTDRWAQERTAEKGTRGGDPNGNEGRGPDKSSGKDYTLQAGRKRVEGRRMYRAASKRKKRPSPPRSSPDPLVRVQEAKGKGNIERQGERHPAPLRSPLQTGALRLNTSPDLGTRGRRGGGAVSGTALDRSRRWPTPPNHARASPEQMGPPLAGQEGTPPDAGEGGCWPEWWRLALTG
jgi:hypothetical protein